MLNLSHRIHRWSRFLALQAQGWHLSRWADIFSFPHRLEGYQYLNGAGLGIEVGAFNCPASLPPKCQVRYCDLQSKEQAQSLFPEIDSRRLMAVDEVMDLDQSGLQSLGDQSQDFVILNHILEHVANPILVLSECIRVLRPGGFAVLSIPDKDYSFDKTRELTSFEHLRQEYEQNIREVSDAHYIDFVRAVYPKEYARGPKFWQKHFDEAKLRHEHAHVWNSGTFERFVRTTFNEILHVPMTPLFESLGEDNRYEYFSVWQLSERPQRV